MDRIITHVGAVPRSVDILSTNKNLMVAMGYLMRSVLGTSLSVDGLACTPNSPADLTVKVGPGSIHKLENVDGTAYGVIDADTTNQIMKQGLAEATQSFSCPAPTTTGHSRVYLIQAAYQDQDTGAAVLPYYNASNPSVPWSGPNNTGVSQNTVRKGVCLLGAKAGISATTGTQATPAPDAGYVGLYAVTVANGQTTINSGDIQRLATAPFIGTKLPEVVTAIQQGKPGYAQDTSGAANTITVTLDPIPSGLNEGMPIRVKVANTVTGATVMNVNGGGNVAVVTSSGAALPSGAMVANGIYTLVYDANGTRWQLQGFTAAAVGFTTGDVKLTFKAAADSGWVMCDDGTIGNASSGASNRANADTEPLYTLLWNNVSNTHAPVSTGRGANAAADFAAGKTIALTKALGRAIGIAGSGSGLTARALGLAVGAETHTLVEAEMPSHTHTANVSDPGHAHSYQQVAAGGSGQTTGGASSYNTPATTGPATTGVGVTNSNTGGGGAHNNMQPTTFMNAMIKL